MIVIAKTLYWVQAIAQTFVQTVVRGLHTPVRLERGASTAEYVATILLGMAFAGALIAIVMGGGIDGPLKSFIQQSITMAQQKLK